MNVKLKCKLCKENVNRMPIRCKKCYIMVCIQCSSDNTCRICQPVNKACGCDICEYGKMILGDSYDGSIKQLAENNSDPFKFINEVKNMERRLENYVIVNKCDTSFN